MNGGYFYIRNMFAEPSTRVSLSADAIKGSSTISVSSVPAWAKPGYIFFISQLDDPAYCWPNGIEGGECPLYYAVGEQRGMSQLNRLVSTTATSMTFEQPMMWNYSVASRRR